MLAIVTGASAGIGEAFAHRLAAEGCELAIVARRRERLLALAHRLQQQYATRVQMHAADLREPILAAGRLTRNRLGAYVAQLREHLTNTDTLTGQPLLWQAWGTKP